MFFLLQKVRILARYKVSDETANKSGTPMSVWSSKSGSESWLEPRRAHVRLLPIELRFGVMHIPAGLAYADRNRMGKEVLARSKISPGDQRDLHLLGQKQAAWREPRSHGAEDVLTGPDDFRLRGWGG
jgi:hypothetical protein